MAPFDFESAWNGAPVDPPPGIRGDVWRRVMDGEPIVGVVPDGRPNRLAFLCAVPEPAASALARGVVMLASTADLPEPLLDPAEPRAVLAFFPPRDEMDGDEEQRLGPLVARFDLADRGTRHALAGLLAQDAVTANWVATDEVIVIRHGVMTLDRVRDGLLRALEAAEARWPAGRAA